MRAEINIYNESNIFTNEKLRDKYTYELQRYKDYGFEIIYDNYTKTKVDGVITIILERCYSSERVIMDMNLTTLDKYTYEVIDSDWKMVVEDRLRYIKKIMLLTGIRIVVKFYKKGDLVLL